MPEVREAPQHDQGADGEPARESIEPIRGEITPVLRTHGVNGHQYFRSDGIAPPLLGRTAIRPEGDVGERASSQPHVGELVDHREDLCGLAVGAVDEHDRSEVVDEGEPAELLGAQGSMRVGADDPAHHDEGPAALDPITQKAEGGAPARGERSQTGVDAEDIPKALRDDCRIVVPRSTADVRHRVHAGLERMVAVPVLTRLAQVDGVEEVSGGPADRRISQSAQVRHRQRFLRRGGQEELTEGSMRGMRELLELLHRGFAGSLRPLGELGEPPRRRLPVPTGALDGPGEQGGVDIDVNRHDTTSFRRLLDLASPR